MHNSRLTYISIFKLNTLNPSTHLLKYILIEEECHEFNYSFFFLKRRNSTPLVLAVSDGMNLYFNNILKFNTQISNLNC
jgi:hypothetical protein